MITLLNRDQREREAAFAAVLRRCRSARGRLLVIADERSSAALGPGLRGADDCPSGQVQIARIDPGALDGADGLLGAIRALRSSVLPFAGDPAPLVVWIECPLSPRALADRGGLGAYEQGLRRYVEPLVETLISAHSPADAGLLVLGRRLGRRAVVLTGSALAGRHGRSALADAADGEATARADRPMLSLAEIVRAENLGDSKVLITGFLVELSNPLAIVSSALQYLHDRLPADEPAQELITIACRGAERMREMLQRMRCLTPALALELREADLNELVLAALRSAAEDCQWRGIVPEASLADEPLRGRFDPARLIQVLLNLLVNAIEADPAPGGALCVRTQSGEGGRRAIVAVESGGPPIADAAVKRLFRPFFITRADDTGLGLHISRQIVVAHGGSIHAENVAGGVKFTVVLPLRG